MPKPDQTQNPNLNQTVPQGGQNPQNPQTQAPRATNPDGRGASNDGGVSDQESADETARKAKDAEKDANAPGDARDGRNMRAGTPTGPQPGTLSQGANNPADGTPIQQPTGDVTRPDATKGPLHNPGVVVEAGMEDPSPSTAVAPGTVGAPQAAKRDMTDPSRKH